MGFIADEPIVPSIVTPSERMPEKKLVWHEGKPFLVPATETHERPKE